MREHFGYNYLIERYRLPALPLSAAAVLGGGVKGRKWRRERDGVVELFEAKYRPEDSLSGHLQFALRYEGINLQVLALLFAKTGARELAEWIGRSPGSRYARIACYLYEWLTGEALALPVPVPARAAYVPVADCGRQLAFPSGERNARYRVRNNLPGNRDFCPLVRITPDLQAMAAADLRRKARDVLARYDPDLLRRAAAYLYLKETQSSFEIEREKPSSSKAQRFADLLRQADAKEPLSVERITALQQAIIDPRFHEFHWRQQQNWVGKDLGYRQQIDFVPPRPEDVTPLMSGLLVLAQAYAEMLQGDVSTADADSGPDPGPDPILMAAVIAFGFIYIHPFMDGNGRIHRYLIHDVLAKTGFTPPGVVLPVSAVILATLDDYIAALETFSKPLNRLTDYNPAQPDIPATGNDPVYFRYPDLTAQAEFLYRSLDYTVTRDLDKEIGFLVGFDRASTALKDLLDWPGRDLDLFIRLVQQNGGKLSAVKRQSHFQWMKDDEICAAEELVRESFGD